MAPLQKSANEPNLSELSAVLKLFTLPGTAELEGEFNETLQKVNNELAKTLKSKNTAIDVIKFMVERSNEIISNAKTLELIQKMSNDISPKNSISPDKKSILNGQNLSVERVLKDLEYDKRQNIDLNSPRSLRNRTVVLKNDESEQRTKTPKKQCKQSPITSPNPNQNVVLNDQKLEDNNDADCDKLLDDYEAVQKCFICKSEEEGETLLEKLVECSSCNSKIHTKCAQWSSEAMRAVFNYPWQCMDCKECSTCGNSNDENKMVYCDACDRGFHIFCVGLNEIPNDKWRCEKYCEIQQTNENSSSSATNQNQLKENKDVTEVRTPIKRSRSAAQRAIQKNKALASIAYEIPQQLSTQKSPNIAAKRRKLMDTFEQSTSTAVTNNKQITNGRLPVNTSLNSATNATNTDDNEFLPDLDDDSDTDMKRPKKPSVTKNPRRSSKKDDSDYSVDEDSDDDSDDEYDPNDENEAKSNAKTKKATPKPSVLPPAIPSTSAQPSTSRASAPTITRPARAQQPVVAMGTSNDPINVDSADEGEDYTRRQNFNSKMKITAENDRIEIGHLYAKFGNKGKCNLCGKNEKLNKENLCMKCHKDSLEFAEQEFSLGRCRILDAYKSKAKLIKEEEKK